MVVTSTSVPKSIGTKYSEIPDNSRQIWVNPQFSLLKVSQAEIARMRNDNTIPKLNIEIIKFLKMAKFATAAQISKAVKKKVSDEFLGTMVKSLFLNEFILSEFEVLEDLKNPDVLKIYTLDFGGQYLMSILGEDMTNWRYTDLMIGTSIIKKNLIQTELLIGFLDASKITVRDYKQFKDMRIGSKIVRTDFQVSFKNIQNSSSILDFVGFIVPAGTEDVSFREYVDGLQTLFFETQAWKRYYPIGVKPKFLIVIEDSSDTSQIVKVANILGQLTDLKPQDVLIVGYNEISTVGLGKSNYFSFNTKEVDGSREVSVGKIKSQLFV